MWIFYATAQVLFYGSTQVTGSLFLEIASPARKKDKDPYYSRGGMLLLYGGGRQKKKIGLKDWRPQLPELFVSKHDESNSVELIIVRLVAEAVKEAQSSGPRA